MNDNSTELVEIMDLQSRIRSDRLSRFRGSFLTEPYTLGLKEGYIMVDQFITEAIAEYPKFNNKNSCSEKTSANFNIMKDLKRTFEILYSSFTSKYFKDSYLSEYLRGISEIYELSINLITSTLAVCVKSGKEDEEDFDDNYWSDKEGQLWK